MLQTVEQFAPESEQDAANASTVLNQFFQQHYRTLNPKRERARLAEILEVGMLCSQAYGVLGVGQAFRQDPWFWVWKGLEEEIRPYVETIDFEGVMQAQKVFHAHNKGSKDL